MEEDWLIESGSMWRSRALEKEEIQKTKGREALAELDCKLYISENWENISDGPWARKVRLFICRPPILWPKNKKTKKTTHSHEKSAAEIFFYLTGIHYNSIILTGVRLVHYENKIFLILIFFIIKLEYNFILKNKY